MWVAIWWAIAFYIMWVLTTIMTSTLIDALQFLVLHITVWAGLLYWYAMWRYIK